jgi:hypothetical protein
VRNSIILQSDSILLSGISWRIKGNPNNNSEFSPHVRPEVLGKTYRLLPSDTTRTAYKTRNGGNGHTDSKVIP